VLDVGSRSHLRPPPGSPKPAVMAGDNSVSVVLPAVGFINVARLVATGFASQLSLGFEAVDDLQLAVELVLRSVPAHGTHVTVALVSEADGLKVALGPFEAQAAERHLRDTAQEGMPLGSVLSRLVDSFDVVGVSEATLVLHKRLEAGTA
jgi:hypothetical protein